jgi:DnaJ family protein A protein 2
MFFGGGGFPGHGGGFPGHPGGGQVDNDEYYEALGVSKSATNAEIKKAYRKMAVKHHPDKGGDEDTFKKISEAYAVLSDSEKKQLYDQYGKEGVSQGGGGGPQGSDIFSMFFGGGQQRGPRGPQKGEDVVHPLKVTLENLCNGKTVKLSINRQRVKYPKGMDAETAVSDCPTCHGRGFVMVTHQIGPGMIQQMKQRCKTCSGAGKSYKKGVKVVKEKKILEVHVDKGMQDKQKIVFSGEADEAPGQLPGDVIFVIDQQEHETFQRKGADLIMEKKISLKDALTGFSLNQKHPDGRTLIIKTKPNEIIEPNSVKAIVDAGMPVHKSPFQRGCLFIMYRVEFPKSLTDPQVTALRAALPGKSSNAKNEAINASDEDIEEVTMFDSTIQKFGQTKASNAHSAQYDSEDEGDGQQRVQCQQS